VAGLGVISVLTAPKALAVIPEQLIFGITNIVTPLVQSLWKREFFLSRLAKK